MIPRPGPFAAVGFPARAVLTGDEARAARRPRRWRLPTGEQLRRSRAGAHGVAGAQFRG
jgi:hypothetical protein